VVEDTLILSAALVWAKEDSFSDILLIAIFAEVTEYECVRQIEAELPSAV